MQRSHDRRFPILFHHDRPSSYVVQYPLDNRVIPNARLAYKRPLIYHADLEFADGRILLLPVYI